MRWKRTQDDEGIPLDQLVPDDKFPREGGWTYTNYFVQVDVVLANGKLPSDFDLCKPEDDLAVMMAHNNRKSKMAIYEDQRRKANAPKGTQ